MVATVVEWFRSPGSAPFAREWARLAIIGFLLWAGPRCAFADAPPEVPVDGLFITVKNPITTSVVSRVVNKASRFLDRPDHRGLKIVFDFNPGDYPAATADYGPCRTLARYILDLRDVTTVAFVHNEVAGHTVLPVLACQELVMSKGGAVIRDQAFSRPAKLGDVLRDQTKHLDKDQEVFYLRVAERNGWNPAVVLKMADPNVEVIEGTRNNAVWYLDRRQLTDPKEADARKGFVPVLPIKVVVNAGATALYGAEQALALGLCQLSRETRQEVAEAYGMPPGSLREDLLGGRPPVACKVEVEKEITAGVRETIMRRVSRAIAGRGVNFVLVKIACHGGDPEEARELGNFFRTLKDDKGEEPVMTVAYVTKDASDNALFLALGCGEIVMAEDAYLGDFERVVGAEPRLKDQVRDTLELLAREQGYPPLIVRAMFEPGLSVYKVRSQKGPLERRLMDGDELQRDRQGAQRWKDESQIKPPEAVFSPHHWFKIDAAKARELNLARAVVEGPPEQALPKIYALYNLENVHDASQDWLDAFAAFLRTTTVKTILIIVGIIGLILELKLPGVVFPGIVAALCFVLYFWAAWLSGHLAMLAVLLFVLGLILIGLEIFVVPGFGITGISGIVLVVLSLALATLVKKPETTREWLDFGSTLSQVALSLLAAMGAAFVLATYLPSIPYVNRLVLKPLSTDPNDDLSPLAATEQTRSLLGIVGEAATTLRPAGKVRFGEELLDVIAEGSFVEAGTRVQVVEVEANRIVVKPV